MSVELINNTQEAFTIVNKTVTMDRSLSLRERGMMVTLLSLPPVWKFSAKGIAAILPDGKDAVNSSLKVLERKNYIIREQSRGEKGVFSDTKLILNPNPSGISREEPLLGEPLTDFPHTENPTSENPTQINNKEIITNEIKINESIIHSEDDYSRAREFVREQIDYDAVMHDRRNDITLLDSIVELIVRTLLDTREKIVIGNIAIPAEEVKLKFRRLNIFNVEYVIDRVKETKTRITNQNAYLMSCLYRAEEQEDLYWDNLVKSDLNKTKE